MCGKPSGCVDIAFDENNTPRIVTMPTAQPTSAPLVTYSNPADAGVAPCPDGTGKTLA
jgi:hypothetical protein